METHLRVFDNDARSRRGKSQLPSVFHTLSLPTFQLASFLLHVHESELRILHTARTIQAGPTAGYASPILLLSSTRCPGLLTTIVPTRWYPRDPCAADGPQSDVLPVAPSRFFSFHSLLGSMLIYPAHHARCYMMRRLKPGHPIPYVGWI
jgi:hypothetical protein